MAIGNSTDRDRRTPTTARGWDLPGTVSRYDLLLGAIPVAFLLGTLTHLVAQVPLRVGLALAAAVGLFVLADGLFLNPPRDSPPS